MLLKITLLAAGKVIPSGRLLFTMVRLWISSAVRIVKFNSGVMKRFRTDLVVLKEILERGGRESMQTKMNFSDIIIIIFKE